MKFATNKKSKESSTLVCAIRLTHAKLLALHIVLEFKTTISKLREYYLLVAIYINKQCFCYLVLTQGNLHGLRVSLIAHGKCSQPLP